MNMYQFNYNGVTLEFSHAQVNQYSSKYNCEDTVPEYGSEDFFEAVADLVMELEPSLTETLQYDTDANLVELVTRL